MTVNPIVTDLNPEQEEAVRWFDSPLLIVAGAGSGKTKVITHKIAHLIHQDKLSPLNILGVTFTNKAAEEMKHRIGDLTGIDEVLFNISTFHSLGLKILREAGQGLGFDQNWRVGDDREQKQIFETIIREKYNHYTNDMRENLRRRVNLAKMEGLYPNNPALLSQRGFSEDEIQLFSAYYSFQQDQKVWDFEDLISFPVRLLQQHDNIREKYRSKFQYVLVDEFQDTNPNQYELIKLIAGGHKQITIVGDDDQAIYSWRGASIRFLFDFEDDFPNCKIIKLQQNFRSSQPILDFANDLIRANSQRRPKAMWTEKREGNPVFLLNSLSKEDEARLVAELIIEIKKPGNKELFPVAILYRNNSQSLAFESEFLQRGINFMVIKGQRFFDRKEVKDGIALLRLAVNPDDDMAFLRIIDFLPLGIGIRTQEKLLNNSRDSGLSLFHSLQEFMSEKFDSRPFFKMIKRLNQSVDGFSYGGLLDLLLEDSGYRAILKDRNEDDRLLNLKELVEFIEKWEKEYPAENFNQLLDIMAMGSPKKGDGTRPDVFLLTMHNAKGLEFPTVVTSGINSTFMPFFLRKGRAEIEEERRLFYVASTRAINQLVISTGSDRPSRFLNAIRAGLFKTAYTLDTILDQITPGKGEESEVRPEEGQRYLEHPVFGRGIIINQNGESRFLVNFFEKGKKWIDISVVKVQMLD